MTGIHGTRTTLRRHVPVKGHRGIYVSDSAKGERYEIAYRDADGKRHFKVVGPSLKQALAEQAQIKVKVAKGVKAHYAPRTFGAVAQEWAEYKYHRVSPGSVRMYQGVLENFLTPKFGTRKIRSITTDQVAQFLAGLKTETGKPMSGSYAQNIYGVLNQVLGYAANERRGYIPANPCDSLEDGERPKVVQPDKRALTELEKQALLFNSPEWFKPILLTALGTGMRAGEVLGLRWPFIDFENSLVQIHWQFLKGQGYVPTKGREKRDVPLVPDLRVVLFDLPTRFSGDYVFAQPEGGRATYDGLQRAFLKARTDAGLDPKLTFHNTRHTYASALLRDGKDVTRVSKYLGHKNPTVTMNTYAHVIEKEDWSTEVASRLREAIGDLR